MTQELLFALVAVFVIALAVPLLFHYTAALGPRSTSPMKGDVYESGVSVPLGDTTAPFGVKFYLVAIMFVLFDVEIVFLFPWAVNVRELAFLGVAEMFLFIGLLFSGLLYVYGKKALKWQ